MNPDDLDEAPVTDPVVTRESSGRALPHGALGLAVLAALLVGVLATLWVVQVRTSPPSEFGADAGFSRDMQTHHQQAVEMSLLVRDRTSDEEVRTVAYDILTSQQQQAGQMYGWLVAWGLPQTSSRPPMAWVGGEHAAAHTDADGRMAGMASPEQMDALEMADGVEAERLFLRLMIDHHEGGVAMADAAVDDARTDEVRTLAGAISRAQATEIELLERMLAERS